MLIRRLVPTLLCIVFFAAYARSETYYVSPEGSDTNDAKSENKPWLTLSSLETQQAFASVVSESVTILIRRNATYVNDPLRLNVENIHGSVFLGAYGDPSLPRPLRARRRAACPG